MAIRLKVQEDKVRLKVGQGEGATLNAVREARPVLVNDYDDLINKPTINGVELEGNLTTEDLHIQAGVTSWNGQTGDVVYTPPEVPVQSVNGEVGAVVLTASDVNALPDTTPIPRFTSDLVNNSGFITEITESDVTSALGFTPYNATNPSGYVNASQAASAAPVQSVNGQTGAVVLDADDVGALPDDTTYVGSVSVTPNLTSGTKVGSIDIDGTSTDLYAPTNTDTKVTQTATTTSDYTYWRGLCVGNSAVQSESGAFSTVTDAVRTFNNIRVQPSSGTIKATTFKGDLTGDVTGTASGNLKSGDNVSSLTNDVGYLTSSTGVTSVNGNTGAVTVTEGLAPLTGTTAAVTPTQVSTAIGEGRDVLITHIDNTFGVLEFSAFNEATTMGVVISNTLVYYYGAMYAYQIIGWKGTDEWETRADVLALTRDIPTNVSSFNNDVGYLTASTGVTSVNGSSGAVTVSVPTKTSDLTNDSGYLTLATLPIWDGGVI